MAMVFSGATAWHRVRPILMTVGGHKLPGATLQTAHALGTPDAPVLSDPG